MAGNYTANDSIDGGDGTDTVTMSVTGTVAPTLTNVEQATVSFTTGGAFNAGNATGLTSITLNESVDGTPQNATVTNIKTGTQIIVTDADAAADADIAAVTLDTVAAAALTVSVQHATAAAMTITDASSVTLNAASTGANASTGSLVLDDNDTTSLTVNGAAGAFTLGTGNITGTDSLTSLTASSSSTTGTVTLGTMVDADSLTSLTVNAANANVTTGAIGGTGTGEVLANVTASATGSSTATFGAITADTTNSATDLEMTMSLSSETGSTVTFGAITNTFGSITATATGDGAFNLGNDTTGIISLASGSFDLTAATGTNVINLVTTSGTTTVSLASGQGSDTVNVGSGGLVSITNFETGAGGDEIGLDISDIGVITTANDVDVAAATASDIGEISAAATTAAADNVIILTGANFATAALAEAAIENGGSRELTINAANDANDDLILVWSDGSNSYIGAYNITSTATNPLAGGLTTIAELVNVVASTAGTMHIDNFDFIA